MRQCRNIIRLCFTLLCLGGGLVALPTSQAQMPDDWTRSFDSALLPPFVGDMVAYADAPHYTIDMRITPRADRAVVSGHQAVTYTNRTSRDMSEIVFRLYPNLESYGGEMQVYDITAGGTPIPPHLDNTHSVLTIPLLSPLQPGRQIMLEMHFKVTVIADRSRLYNQFAYLDGVLALPNAYPMLSVYEPDQGWWQVVEHPQGDIVFSETAFYTVRVTAPHDLTLAASGSQVDSTANSDGTITHTYVAPLMRDFALFGSTRFATRSSQQDGVTVTVYYDPSLSQADPNAAVALKLTRNAIGVYNQAFGPYPFTELDVVQTPTTAGGLEYPGLFVVGTNTWDENEVFFEFVIIHETAHQWWYSLVGNDQALHPWIDEALAQYSVAVYIRSQEGETAYEAAIASFRSQHSNYVASGGDQVIGLPVSAYADNAYFYMIYQKAPLLLAELEESYGYDSVLGALQSYLVAYRYDIAQSDDLLESFEQALGQDLEPLFEEWVGEIGPN